MGIGFNEARAEFVDPTASRLLRAGQNLLAVAVWLLDKEYPFSDDVPTAATVEVPWDIGAVHSEAELDAVMAKAEKDAAALERYTPTD